MNKKVTNLTETEAERVADDLSPHERLILWIMRLLSDDTTRKIPIFEAVMHAGIEEHNYRNEGISLLGLGLLMSDGRDTWLTPRGVSVAKHCKVGPDEGLSLFPSSELRDFCGMIYETARKLRRWPTEDEVGEEFGLGYSSRGLEAIKAAEAGLIESIPDTMAMKLTRAGLLMAYGREMILRDGCTNRPPSPINRDLTGK